MSNVSRVTHDDGSLRSRATETETAFLRSEDREIYRWIAGYAHCSINEIASGTGRKQQEIETSIGRLLRMHLVRVDSTSPSKYFAVSPETARVELVAPLQRDIENRQHEVDRMRAALYELTSAYQEGVARCAGPASVEVVTSPSQAADLIAQLAASCRSQILLSEPDLTAAVATMPYFHSGGRSVLSADVEVRILFPHTARFRRDLAERMQAAQRNMSYRTRSDSFMPLIVFDGQVAVFSDHARSDAIVLVRDSAVVSFAVAAFERAWTRGITFSTSYERQVVKEISESTKRTILHLMVQGIDDRLIARRLNMSLRSCQRHIEVIMRRLGAKTRMQAGYLVSERGLLKD
ncbi:LuxR C-terminal-related transcriptional regulator [Streptomyces sp. NPDC039022]|uniref:LuxR C-terminal-related transcriptional regulator n=1 Tax=Streptomyces sp. NPDC039022 TaxID=3157091 RepID=UPI0033E094E4